MCRCLVLQNSQKELCPLYVYEPGHEHVQNKIGNVV